MKNIANKPNMGTYCINLNIHKRESASWVV